MSRRAEDFEKCYPAEHPMGADRGWRPLLDELGIPVLMLTDPYDVGRGFNDRPSPRIPFWAARVLNWMGLSPEETETALRRLSAEPALRATVRDLTQLIRTDAIQIALQSFSFKRDASGQLPTSRLLHVDATPPHERPRDVWSVRYDARTGAILAIKAASDGEPMPLHVAIAVQAAIDEFERGDAVMHALGTS